MTTNEAALPLLFTLGLFLVSSQWLQPESALARQMWRWLRVVILGRYLAWRVLETLPEPGWHPVFMYQASCLGVEAVFWYLVMRIRLRERRQRNRSAEADAHANWWRESSDAPPLIDVLIPTYNESREILERTLVGAIHLDYPRYRVWILDDGNRDWLAEWAEELGVRYLRRADNRHYKAGNLNSAIAQITGSTDAPDFIAVVDADFVLVRGFLLRTLALMYDPAVAVVQTPQHFFNPDPFQHSIRSRVAVPDEQRIFFDYSQPILDFQDAATCCGTSFLLRRDALLRVGGFPTESVSEDTLLSIKLQRLGLKTVYLNEPLSSGLNPDGLKEYLTQRARWSLGQVQIARSRWGPLAAGRKLKNYVEFWVEACSWSFFCFYHFFGAAVSSVFWLTGVYTMKASFLNMLYWAGPLWIDGFILSWMTRGRYVPIATEATEVVTSFSVIPTTYQALKGSTERAFVVTAKGVQRERVVVHWLILCCVLLPAALQLAGIVLALRNPQAPARSDGLFGIVLYHSALAVLTFVAAALPCVELPNRRRNDRFPTRETAMLEADGLLSEVRVADISTTGVRIVQSEVALRVGQNVRLTLSNVGTLSARVLRASRREMAALLLPSTTQRIAMIRKLYCTSGEYVSVTARWNLLHFLGAVGRRLIN